MVLVLHCNLQMNGPNFTLFFKHNLQMDGPCANFYVLHPIFQWLFPTFSLKYKTKKCIIIIEKAVF